LKSEDLLNYIGNVDDRYVDELFGEPISVQKKKSFSYWGAVAAAFALFIIGAFAIMLTGGETPAGSVALGGNYLSVPMAQNRVILLDVNPSISLEVDDRDQVVCSAAINDDGKAILADVNVVGCDYNVAVNMLVGELEKQEYITELKNSVMVTVVCGDETEAEAMRASTVQAVVSLSAEDGIQLSVLSQIMTDSDDYSDLSLEFKVSVGRVKLIEELCAEHESYSFDTMVTNTVHTLNQILDYVGLPEFVHRDGAVSCVVPADCRANLSFDSLTGEDVVSFANSVSEVFSKLHEEYADKYKEMAASLVFNIGQTTDDDGNEVWSISIKGISGSIFHGAIINMGQAGISAWKQLTGSSSLENDIESFIEKIEDLG